MIGRFRVFAATLVILLSADALAAQTVERLFYYVDRDEAWESLETNIERIDVVASTGYSVDEYGVVWGDIDPRVTALAAEHDVDVLALIVNPGFDQELLHALLSSDAARARAVASMVELCRRHDLAGIQFDFENISISDRDAYTRFFQEAAEALHAADCSISMAVVHRPDVLPGPTRYHGWLFENWRAGYDLAEIGGIADFVSLMSYSQHTRRTPPGPQASVRWQRDVVEYFLEHIPASKLSLGIPTSGQHWYTSQEDRITPELARSYSEQVSHDRALALLERYDGETFWSDEHAVPYGFFERGGTWEWIFWEDARSFQAKLGLVDEYGLRGFSVWVLGPEDPAIWRALDARAGGRR
ncbi:MAG: glycosyl hydrolase family 18 protein [Longimicrobiales bacterium]